MKSIGVRIFTIMTMNIATALIILGIFSCYMNYSSTMSSVENNFIEMAEIASNRASWEIQNYSHVAVEIGTVETLCDPNASKEEKQAVLDERAEYYGFQRCNLIDANGDGIDGNNYSDREYYKRAMQGEPYVSSPLISKITGKVTIIVAAPLWENGKIGGTPIGCAYVVPDEEFLNDIVRDINVSENSAAYIINSAGDTIADVDSEVILNGENIEALAKENEEGGYETLAAVHKRMRAGESGQDVYTLNGEKKFIGYAPIDETDGWSLAVYAPYNDFMHETNRGISFTIVIIVAASVFGGFMALLLGKDIGKSIRICTERMEKLAEGDLKSPVPEIRSKDETGRLAEASKTVVNNLNGIISDIGRILSAMADGDLAVNTETGERNYVGDYTTLIDSMRNITDKLDSTMAQINTAADQVSSGSNQVSAGAQALSQGATEQASEIESLASRIHTISEEVSENSDNCDSAKTLVSETVEYMNIATEEMSRLTEAMSTISETSGRIENIIKTIEDIAFQTNILALNAAVEAARAGEAGKGFAVVADEVRNLASKSADAAKSTTSLIEQSIEAVQNGTQIAADTAEAISNVGSRASGVEDIVGKIAEASEKQSEMIDQITTGIEQISGVVQTNSATAEESAAASEELSGQSSMLKELIGAFNLKS